MFRCDPGNVDICQPGVTVDSNIYCAYCVEIRQQSEIKCGCEFTQSHGIRNQNKVIDSLTYFRALLAHLRTVHQSNVQRQEEDSNQLLMSKGTREARAGYLTFTSIHATFKILSCCWHLPAAPIEIQNHVIGIYLLRDVAVDCLRIFTSVGYLQRADWRLTISRVFDASQIQWGTCAPNFNAITRKIRYFVSANGD